MAERRATTGRIAIALAHDIGKELAWIAELASRLPDRADDPRRLGHEADQIGALADAALRDPMFRARHPGATELLRALETDTTWRPVQARGFSGKELVR